MRMPRVFSKTGSPTEHPQQGHQNQTKEAWENEEDIYDDLEVLILGWFQTNESSEFLWCWYQKMNEKKNIKGWWGSQNVEIVVRFASNGWIS